MRDPNDLRAFALADELVLEVYRLSASFPVDERYGLTSQVRRAAVSVASNIVEGCSRESQPDFRRFVELALGSAMEARYQLTLARRLGFRGDALMLETEDKASEVVRVLIGLAKALRPETSHLSPGS